MSAFHGLSDGKTGHPPSVGLPVNEGAVGAPVVAGGRDVGARVTAGRRVGAVDGATAGAASEGDGSAGEADSAAGDESGGAVGLAVLRSGPPQATSAAATTNADALSERGV